MPNPTSAPAAPPATEGATMSNPVRVVSAVVFRDETLGEVLLGVRRGTPATPRHPGVLSTPTLRVPAAVFDVLLDDFAGMPRGPGVRAVDRAPEFMLGRDAHPTSVAAFVYEDLLIRKLGLAAALTWQRIRATARPEVLALDRVEDRLGTDESEWTLMLTCSVTILRGAAELPPSTDAFSRLVWAPRTLVGDALARRDALLIDQTLDPFEVCIGGLCIRSAVDLLDRP